MSPRQKLADVTKLVDAMHGEEASDLPPPLARTAAEGQRMTRAILGQYLPNISHVILWVAIGDSNVSAHTRWNAANTALSLYNATNPEPAAPTGDIPTGDTLRDE